MSEPTPTEDEETVRAPIETRCPTCEHSMSYPGICVGCPCADAFHSEEREPLWISKHRTEHPVAVFGCADCIERASHG